MDQSECGTTRGVGHGLDVVAISFRYGSNESARHGTIEETGTGTETESGQRLTIREWGSGCG